MPFNLIFDSINCSFKYSELPAKHYILENQKILINYSSIPFIRYTQTTEGHDVRKKLGVIGAK